MLKGLCWLGWKTFSKARRQIAGSLGSSTGTERMERWRCESWGTRDRADMKRWMRGKRGPEQEKWLGARRQMSEEKGKEKATAGARCRLICTAGGLAAKMKDCNPVVSVICVCKYIQRVGSDALPASMTCCPLSQGKKKRKKASPNPLEWVARRCALHRCVGVRNVHIYRVWDNESVFNSVQLCTVAAAPGGAPRMWDETTGTSLILWIGKQKKNLISINVHVSLTTRWNNQ